MDCVFPIFLSPEFGQNGAWRFISIKRYLPKGLVQGKERECLSWFHGDLAFNRLGLTPTRMNLSANVLLHCNAVFGWNVIGHLMNMLNKTKPW